MADQTPDPDVPKQIKEEPTDDSTRPQVWPFAPGQVIPLFEEDDMDISIPTPQAEKEASQEGDTTNTSPKISPKNLDLGQSVLRKSAKPTGEERRLAAQRKFAHIKKMQSANLSANETAEPVPSSDRRAPEKDILAEKYARAKQAFERKKRAGKLSFGEEIEWMKAEAQERSRLRKMKRDQEYDRSSPSDDDDGRDNGGHGEGGLFVPEYDEIASDDDDQEEEVQKPKKRGRKRKVENVDDEEEAQPAPKRGRPKGAKTATGKGKTQTDKSKAKKPGPKKAKAPQMLNMDSIMGTDIFGDAAKAEQLPDQPTFDQTTRRHDALKQLIASVPTGDKDAKKIRHSDLKYLDDAIKDLNGTGAVRPGPDGNWTLKGMKSSLKPFQVLGLAFMRRRETGSTKPNGGILADQMGLGKTVTALANVINGRPRDNAKLKTTLIVASPALILQWAEELEKHCLTGRDAKQHGITNYMVYRAGHRHEGNDPTSVLQSHDVVFTTYHEVAKSYPKHEIPAKYVTAEQKSKYWREYYEEMRGVLHSMRFYRVVLDEAHAIKNHRSRTSMACRAIDAKHRWAITGTPVMNNIKECYPYFKFLQEPFAGSYRIFKENFCSPGDPEGMSKLAVLLNKVMIRRTHADQFLSARLVDIPKPRQHTLWIEFNDVERQIYEIVRRRFIQRINNISKKGMLEKQSRHIFTMLLRLRQLCSHSLLIQGPLVDLLEREDFEKLNSITANDHQMSNEGGSLLIHLRKVLKDSVDIKTADVGGQGEVITSSESVATDVVDIKEWDARTGGTYGLTFRFRKYLMTLMNSDQWDVITARTECSGCRQKPEDPHVTSCFHIYCLSCLKDLQHMAARRGHDQARCAECGDAYANTQPCEGLDTFNEAKSTGSTAEKATRKAKGKKNEQGMVDWIQMPGEVLPSAKTQAVKSQVLNWREDDENIKIVIYTQFVPMTEILGKMCSTEGWGFVKYTGQMRHDARANAIKEFQQSPSKQVMIASLKAGGEGLNLTMATRVICLDPWWNEAVENQAFCRVYRIGQTKKTELTRFVVKNTIDAAMAALKERKQVEIDMLMTDAKTKSNLSVEELMSLFGEVREDGDGKPFIFADSDEADNRFAAVDDDDEEEENFLGDDE